MIHECNAFGVVYSVAFIDRIKGVLYLKAIPSLRASQLACNHLDYGILLHICFYPLEEKCLLYLYLVLLNNIYWI